MYPKPITPCRCETAGFCPRHQCVKTYAWVLGCRRNWTMFEQWEAGQGPCVDRIRAQMIASASTEQPFVELPRCQHRGADPLEFVDCELCGGRTEKVPVYACVLLSKCTPRRYGTRTAVMRAMPSCVGCGQYVAVESSLPETVSTPLNEPAGTNSL